jgi:hypothetical protein
MNPRTHTRTVTLAAMVLALVLLLPMSAAADTPLTHSGVHGVHGLIDSQEDPAATCHYSSSFQLRKVVVRAPIVYARNTGPGLQAATVGWRFRVQWSSGLGFSNAKTTSIVKASATDSRPAAFTARSVSFTNAPEIEYRVRVDMFWYDAQGHQIGKATHAPDWYGWVATSHGSGIEESTTCGPSA